LLTSPGLGNIQIREEILAMTKEQEKLPHYTYTENLPPLKVIKLFSQQVVGGRKVDPTR